MTFEEFWYLMSTALAMMMSAVIWHYVKKTEKTLENITEIMNDLKRITAMHEKELQQHEKRITKIEDRPIGIDSEDIVDRLIAKIRLITPPK